jgi:hypothetical protein
MLIDKQSRRHVAFVVTKDGGLMSVVISEIRITQLSPDVGGISNLLGLNQVQFVVDDLRDPIPISMKDKAV